MEKILVLGTSGMLGSMVFDYFTKQTKYQVYGTVRNTDYLSHENLLLFDASNVNQLESKEFLDLKLDYIINCIGITKPFCKDDDPEGIKRAIRINVSFPWKLAEYAEKHKIKILQIGTDCVYSGNSGNYHERDKYDPLDVYGKTKSLGDVISPATLIIRCSIIGPQIHPKANFLLEWYLSQSEEGEIGGFAHHIWNGVSTLQFAIICELIIKNNYFNDLMEISHIHHFVPNSTVNKYELMNIFNSVFHRNLKINKINKENEKLDRSLSSKFNLLEQIYKSRNMKEAILELKEYVENSKTFSF